MIDRGNSDLAMALLAAFCLLFGGCSIDSAETPSVVAQKTPVVVVTSFPLFAIVTEIAGIAVVVEWPGQSAASPQDWVPSADDVRRLQSADLILLNGAGYEPWTQNLSLPRSRTIDTTTPATGLAGYANQLLSIDGKVTHQHGPQGSQSVGAVAAVTWLDPELAVAQLNRVELELIKIAPDQHGQISARATALRQRLDQLHARLQALQLKPCNILTDSSDVAYLISALKCELHTVELSVENPAADFAAALKTLEPRVLVFRENAPAAIRKLFVESGVPAVAIDVCDQAIEGRSFVDRLNENLDRLEAAIHEGSK